VAAGWSWRDPIKLLRGLHDDRAVREKATETQQPPPAVSFEFQLGPVEVWPAPRSQ
jgi:hypothetical protein